jgi:hypothetical protein
MRQDKEQKVCGVRLDLLTFYERMKKGTEKEKDGKRGQI